MMITALTLLLLSAEPLPPATEPPLVVVSTAPPGLEKVAGEVGRALGVRLEAPVGEVGGHLKSRGEGCARDLRCLLLAPTLAEAPRVLHLRSRALPGGRLAVDLRLVDVPGRRVLGRSAATVEPGELTAWAERASTRLLTRADPYARTPPPSPFAVKPPRTQIGRAHV